MAFLLTKHSPRANGTRQNCMLDHKASLLNLRESDRERHTHSQAQVYWGKIPIVRDHSNACWTATSFVSYYVVGMSFECEQEWRAGPHTVPELFNWKAIARWEVQLVISKLMFLWSCSPPNPWNKPRPKASPLPFTSSSPRCPILGNARSKSVWKV